jgi:hypothetical protein
VSGLSAPAPAMDSPPAPPAATTCPRCGAPAHRGVGQCAQCRLRYALHAGPRLDPSLTVPPADPQAKRIKVRAAGWLLYHAGILEPDAVQEGTLDPVIGRLPVDSTSIPYGEVCSVAFWRRIHPGHVVVSAILVVLTAIEAIGSLVQPGLWIMTAIFALLTWLALWVTFRVRRWYVRVVGAKGTAIVVRFDKPWWNRGRFHRELLRRCGIAAAEMP